MRRIKTDDSLRHKHQLVASDILLRIRSGTWPKGTKIPSVDELGKIYPFSRMTIFKAIESLTQEGYLEARRGVGTFVAREELQGTIGIVMGEEVLHPQSTPMAFMLTQAVTRHLERSAYRTKLFVEMLREGQGQFPSELREDLLARRLRGLVSASCDAALYLPDWSPWAGMQLPWVDFSGHNRAPHRLEGDEHAFIDLALSYFVSHGRRRVAVISNSPDVGYYREQARLRGVESRDEWIRCPMPGIGSGHEATGFQFMREIWQAPEKPDGLLVLDDIMAKGASQALVQLDVMVPESLLVVSLGNKDSGVFYPVPVARIEIDLQECARLACDLLLDIIRDPLLPPRTVVFRPVMTVRETT